MSDAIVRLLLNTSGFEQNLSRAKGKMKDFSSQGSSTSSVLKGLGGTLTKLTGGLTAIGAAMKVATDAFMTSEQGVDAWGRTVESAKGVYEGFLNSLNTGDISGFLNNIQSIVDAASEAYDALDSLNTYKAFNQVNNARSKARYAEALDAYKLNPTEENKKALTEANAEVVRLLKEQATLQKEAYGKAVESLFTNRGLQGKELKEVVQIFKSGSNRDYTSAKGLFKEYGWIDSFKQGYLGTLDTFKGKRVTTVGGSAYYVDKNNNVTGRLSEEEQKQLKIARALNEVNDTEIQKVQELGAQYEQLIEAVANQNRSFNRMANNNKSPHQTVTTKTTKEQPVFSETASSMKQMKENVTILNKKMETLTIGSEDYVKILRELTFWQKRIKEQQTRDSDISNFYSGKGYGQGMRLSPGTKDLFKTLSPEEAKKLEKVELPKQKRGDEKADEKDKLEAVGQIVGGVDNIVSALEGLGLDVDSGFKKGLKFIQSILTIIEAIKSIESAIQILSTGRDTAYQATVVSELGAIAVSSAITAGVQTVKAIPIIGWALKEGGVVHAASGVVMGQNYVDRVPATLSSGEMVLNPAQQSKLFKMANSGGGGGNESQPYVNAETIVLGIQNWAKRRGKGSELMFTSR